MRIERRAMEKERRFDLVPTGEIFLDEDSSEVYMKIEKVSSYDENGMKVFEANSVNLSNGDLAWFGYHVKVTIPHLHNLIIDC